MQRNVLYHCIILLEELYSNVHVLFPFYVFSSIYGRCTLLMHVFESLVESLHLHLYDFSLWVGEVRRSLLLMSGEVILWRSDWNTLL